MRGLLLLLVTATTAAAQNQYKANRAMAQAAHPAVLWRAPVNISM